MFRLVVCSPCASNLLGALFSAFLHVIELRTYFKLLPQYTTPIHARYRSMTILLSFIHLPFISSLSLPSFFSSSESLLLLHIQVVDRFYSFLTLEDSDRTYCSIT